MCDLLAVPGNRFEHGIPLLRSRICSERRYRWIGAARVVLLALLVAVPLGASADREAVAGVYRAYNDRLGQVTSRDPATLRELQTERLSRSTAECYRDAGCRASEEVLLDVVTMRTYDTVSYVETGAGAVELGIVGRNAGGFETGLVVTFRFEDRRWRIDSVAKVPLNSSRLRR